VIGIHTVTVNLNVLIMMVKINGSDGKRGMIEN